jgi:hypothetical protein
MSKFSLEEKFHIMDSTWRKSLILTNSVLKKAQYHGLSLEKKHIPHELNLEKNFNLYRLNYILDSTLLYV